MPFFPPVLKYNHAVGNCKTHDNLCLKCLGRLDLTGHISWLQSKYKLSVLGRKVTAQSIPPLKHLLTFKKRSRTEREQALNASQMKFVLQRG